MEISLLSPRRAQNSLDEWNSLFIGPRLRSLDYGCLSARDIIRRHSFAFQKNSLDALGALREER